MPQVHANPVRDDQTFLEAEAYKKAKRRLNLEKLRQETRVNLTRADP